MHNYIIQLANVPMEEDWLLDEEAINNSNSSDVDYCSEIEKEERNEVIRYLVDRWVPDGMLSWDGSSDFVIYNGGIDKWINDVFLPSLQFASKSINAKNRFRDVLRNLEKLVADGLGLGNTKFYLSDYKYGETLERSTALVERLSEMNPGDKLYIGGVLDYHW